MAVERRTAVLGDSWTEGWSSTYREERRGSMSNGLCVLVARVTTVKREKSSLYLSGDGD
jgi:hypothetical protein